MNRDDIALQEQEERFKSYQRKLRSALLSKTATDEIGFDVEELPSQMFTRKDIQMGNRPGKFRSITQQMRRMKLFHF